MTPTELCNALLSARRHQRPLAASASHLQAAADVEAACAVQHAIGVELQAWGGDELPGYWKSGAGSRSAALTHAPLMPQGVRVGTAQHATDLRDLHFFTPGIESEVAVRLGRAATPIIAAALTPDDAPDFIDAMAVSIEVVDCRWVDDGALPPLLRLADFQSHGALALGPWAPWRDIDWAGQRCELRVNDSLVMERMGSHPLGTPHWLLPIWLRHLTRHGATVPAGTVVTTGTWTGLTPVQRGSTVQLRFAGLGEAALVL